MKDSLLLRILGSFALIVILVAGSIFGVLSAVSSRAVRGFVREGDREWARQLAPILADWHRTTGGWDGAESLLGAQTSSMGMMMSPRGSTPDPHPLMMMGMMGRSERILVTDIAGTIIIDTARGVNAPRLVEYGEPILDGGRSIARLFVGTMIDPALTEEARRFLKNIRAGVLASAAIVTIVALGMGLLVFRQIMHPLTHLSEASRRIANGEEGVRVPPSRPDELDRLGRQFNRMVESVEAARTRQKQFIAEAAHELRTPVSLIQGTLEMMIDGVYRPSKERLQSLHEESQRLASLVGDLHLLAGSDHAELRVEKEPLDLAEILVPTIELFRGQGSHSGVRMSTELTSGIRVIADSGRLQQVLRNLLSNALRHTPAGGRVVVGCSTDEQSAMATVWVQDTGSGIPVSDREKVFERFYRLDPSRNRETGGSGLGLAIAREIVAAHGGSIWIDPHIDAGTRICFSVPMERPRKIGR